MGAKEGVRIGEEEEEGLGRTVCLWAGPQRPRLPRPPPMPTKGQVLSQTQLRLRPEKLWLQGPGWPDPVPLQLPPVTAPSRDFCSVVLLW